MAILDYFRRIKNMSAEEIRKFLAGKNPDDYNLVDVRQPAEYEKYHLPGARFIPLAELPGRLRELDPKKPTITY